MKKTIHQRNVEIAKFNGVCGTSLPYEVENEVSLLQAMQNKDVARIQSIEKAAEAGEIVRIM